MKRTAVRVARMAPRGAALIMAAMPLSVSSALPGVASGDLPGIDHARVAIPNGELGAHSVTVSEVDSRLAPNEALAAVERHWREQRADTVLRAEAGEWSVLSRRLVRPSTIDGPLENRDGVGGFETLQLRRSPSGGSEGLLTRWQPRDPAFSDSAHSDSALIAALLPEDAHVVRQLGSRGSGERAARTLIARLERTLDDSESHIDRHLRRSGFAPLRAAAHRDRLQWRNDRARFYGSSRAEVLVTLHRQPQGTDVVLYHVESVR